MRNRIRFTTIVFAIALLTVALSGAQAQDDMMGETIVCDSTLITLLYIAENDYGFHSMMDVSQFEKGQFAPLFEEMMAQMDDEMGDMSDEDMGEDMSGEDMSDEDMGDDMSGDDMMVTLEPGVVEGEDPACTELRAEVESFLFEQFTGDTMMGDESS